MKLKKCFKKVLKYFDGDMEKTLIWFGTRIAGLGAEAPLTLIALGKTDKLCEFITATLK